MVLAPLNSMLRYPRLLAEPRLDAVNRRRVRTWMELNAEAAKAFFDEVERAPYPGEGAEPDGWPY